MRLFLTPVILILVLLLLLAGCTAPGPVPLNSSAPASSGSPVTVTNSPAIPPGIVQTRTARVDDINIAYKETGQGTPLLLITGYGATMDLWPPGVLANLSSNHRVIIFDNRGMGNTTASNKTFSIPLFADDAAGLLDALNTSKADILGWSMGADVAQELVLRHPGKVNRLILYAGSPGGNESVPTSPAVIEKLTNTSGSAREQGVRLFSLLFPASWLRAHHDSRAYFPIPTETSPPESYVRQADAMASWNGTFSRLPDIRSPTLVLTGTEDVISVPANAFVIGGRIPVSWVIQVPGGGHGMMYQFPEEFGRVVTFFLDS
ncbi:MAG: alpha/beta hydrolase [Methanomicrobiales archaeon]|nr:alpha/beta hydrolase [Methanomicrobiales archaeon]